MITWMRKIHWGKVFLVALLYTIIATVVRQLPQYFGAWSKLMMPVAGPPPFEFMVTSIVLTFASGMALAIIYYYLKDYLPKGFWHRSTFFADVLVSTSFIFFTLPVFLLFNVPLALLGWWFVSTFVVLFATSLCIVKIVK